MLLGYARRFVFWMPPQVNAQGLAPREKQRNGLCGGNGAEIDIADAETGSRERVVDHGVVDAASMFDSRNAFGEHYNDGHTVFNDRNAAIVSKVESENVQRALQL